ncbi:MAG TPA: hypothetical protein EYP56_11360 [Planctomycetaceae bacterium]|nr:hypothetical protein [Planctomycetaceae bacterium]
MAVLFPPTGYARLGPRPARWVLMLLLVLAVGLVALSVSPLKINRTRKDRDDGDGDIALYLAEVERIRRGEGYYEAAAAELAPRGYPTRSVFNWRTPLPMWLLGKLPDPQLGRILLGLLACAAVVLGFEALAREQGHGLGRPLMAGALLAGALLFCGLEDVFVAPVLWAGVLIALSVGCYGVGRRGWGVLFGVAAVFFRELALPYAVAAAGISWWEGRRRECFAWAVGLAAWSLFFLVHSLHVQPLIGPDARAHEHGWVRLLGIPFVLATVQMNAYLVLLPQWITALYFALALLGLAGWQTPLGKRVGLTACLYAAAFAAVGQEFNQYWGLLVAPLWSYGAAQAPGALRDLVRAAQIPCPRLRRGSGVPSHG